MNERVLLFCNVTLPTRCSFNKSLMSTSLSMNTSACKNELLLIIKNME